MKDMNDVELKVGDFVEFYQSPDIGYKMSFFGKIVSFDYLTGWVFIQWQNPYRGQSLRPYERRGAEIKKLSDEEALLWILVSE